MIFSAADKSITYQYLDTNQQNDYISLCSIELQIGFENNTRIIGLEILRDTYPSDNYAIKISYPAVPLIDIVDISPIWNQNNNTAELKLAGEDIEISTQIKNLGNADTTTEISVEVNIQDSNNLSVFNDSDLIMALNSEEETNMIFTSLFTDLPGNYSINTTTQFSEDINPNNNVKTTELVLVDNTVSPTLLSYVTEIDPNGSYSCCAGTGGLGVLFQSPLVGWWISDVDVFVKTRGGGYKDFTVSIYANKDVDGLPGTLLASEFVPEGSVMLDTWVNVQFDKPVQAPKEGFFVTWQQNEASGVGVGYINSTPFSRQNFEQQGGEWEVWRRNEARDLMIRANLIDLIFTDGFEP